MQQVNLAIAKFIKHNESPPSSVERAKFVLSALNLIFIYTIYTL